MRHGGALRTHRALTGNAPRRYKPQGINRLDATKCAKCNTKVFAVCKLEAGGRCGAQRGAARLRARPKP